MSILQDILASGHIEPELLDALDEEQKQMLFIQMRQEQVRKWIAAEEELEKDPPPKKPKKKSVRWLHGNDDNVWVWVMGEYPGDRTIDEILEEEAREEARQMARREVEGTTYPAEEELKAQLGKIRLGVGVTDSMYDDADSFFSSPPPLLFQPNNPIVSRTVTSSPGNNQPSFVTGQLSYGTNGGSVRDGPMTATVSSFVTPLPQVAVFGSAKANGSAERPRPKAINLEKDLSDEAWQKTMAANGIKMRAPKSMSPEEKSEEMQKRESEIFQSIQDHREQLKREAEIEAEKVEMTWEEREKKAKDAEATIRSIAQKAREQHRAQQLRTSTSILPALKDTKANSLREAIKSLPRPPKPKNRQAILDWFRREELPRGTGLDPKTKAPAPWFHGVISRTEAEDLLKEKPTGSFLVRVSERIWGYTVSYVVGPGAWKHFLVEKIHDGYQFLGTNQVVHDELFDLVSYHETAPITLKGNEILRWAVGQTRRPPDYADLLPEHKSPFRF